MIDKDSRVLMEQFVEILASGESFSFYALMSEIEHAVILAVARRYQGNLHKVATHMKMNRTTLHEKVATKGGYLDEIQALRTGKELAQGLVIRSGMLKAGPS